MRVALPLILELLEVNNEESMSSGISNVGIRK